MNISITTFIEKYNQPSYPLSDHVNLEDLEFIKTNAFTNPSIPYHDRYSIIHDFRHNRKLNAEIEDIFRMAHEKTKVTLRKKRYGIRKQG